MARMIPPTGPLETGSNGERTIYSALAEALPDDFTVIHSVPWLASAAKELDPKAAPTGEVDFLIIHPSLGVLVLEVKGGRYRVDRSIFVLIKSNERVDVVRQTRRNAHGVARWLGMSGGPRLRIGYGFLFPDSHFGDAVINAAMVDTTADPPGRIFIDRGQMPSLSERVVEVMRYWKATHGNPDLGPQKVEAIVGALCPNFDGTPTWASRIVYDGKVWLRLTGEQACVVDQALTRKRMVVSGWPGTGKTLIGIEAARRIGLTGQRVLLVTFNNRLAEYINPYAPTIPETVTQ